MLLLLLLGDHCKTPGGEEREVLDLVELVEGEVVAGKEDENKIEDGEGTEVDHSDPFSSQLLR